jgi:hypothetical protein
MADTQRILADVLTLLADNTAGAISPQDLRDVIISLTPAHGAAYVSSAAAQPTIVQNTWYEVAGTWTLSADNYRWTLPSGGRLQYDGAAVADATVIGNISFTSASNNITYEVGVGLDGTIITASIQRTKLGIGTDTQSVSCAAQLVMPTGTHYLSLMIRNITDTTKPTAVCGHINVLSTLSDD